MARKKPIIVDDYDSTREQFNAVVQGIYESLVKKHLGLPNSKAFKYRGSRLDHRYDLEPEEVRELLSSAFAIATRRGQKYGYLEAGSQRATAKGKKRSAERIKDKKKLAENVQDYEETLAMARKTTAHHRIIRKRGKFYVQPGEGFKASGYTTEAGAKRAIKRRHDRDLPPRRNNGFFSDLFGGGKKQKPAPKVKKEDWEDVTEYEVYTYDIETLADVMGGRQKISEVDFLRQHGACPDCGKVTGWYNKRIPVTSNWGDSDEDRKRWAKRALNEALKEAEAQESIDPKTGRPGSTAMAALRSRPHQWNEPCEGHVVVLVAKMRDGSTKYLDRDTLELKSYDALTKEAKKVCKIPYKKVANPRRRSRRSRGRL